MRRLGMATLLFAAIGATTHVGAQDVSGTIFEDRDADGIRDVGEPPLPGVQVRLFGTASGGPGVDQTVPSAADGSYAFAPGDGCYLLSPADPPGWRAGQSREDGVDPAQPTYLFPVGVPRLSKLDGLVTNLKTGQVRYAALGDSIARSFNFLCGGTAFWYSQQLRSRLECAGSVTLPPLDQAAELGAHSDELLVDDGGLNNVFSTIANQAELVTISMIGNDLLDVDPGDEGTQADTNRAVAEVLDARQNLQEALSSLVSEIPQGDIALNTLYDNLAFDCSPTQFHRTWIPIVNRILRDLAWGQTRRVAINEIFAELAHLDQQSVCTGFQNMICDNFFDGIHPTQNGYTIIREKVWEAAGGVSLGAGDALGRSSMGNADYGYLRRVRRLLPTTWETVSGAVAQDPEAALDDGDAGAPARITLGAGSQEFRLAGFPDWYDEIRIVRVIAGVRYRTTGVVDDEPYRMEASVTDEFRPPPGHAYTPTDWNFFTPIVGGGGPLQPVENPDYAAAATLVVPDVAVYREVSATLTKNPVLAPGGSDYQWPVLTHEDLATTTVRIAAAPEPGATGDDDYEVQLDYAWLDLYGWEQPRPEEVRQLRVDRLPDGTLEASFEPAAGAERYNLYSGRLTTVAGGTYDHGAAAPAGPWCAASTATAAAGRLKAVVPPSEQGLEDLYFLVTAHVDDVESPAGRRSDDTEIDRSQSACR